MPTKLSVRYRSTRRRLAAAARGCCESLERRTLLSTISWTNRNTFDGANDNRFDDVFGMSASVAIGVVDAAIDSWERLIISFGYGPGITSYDITISMDPDGTSLGAVAGPTFLDALGKPYQGAMGIGRGNDGPDPDVDITGDGTPDPVGDGLGWFLDPTPYESSEFRQRTANAFVAYAGPGSDALFQSDMYSVVLHELGHALGLLSLDRMRALATDTLQPDTIDSAVPDPDLNPPVGTYWRFDGAEIHPLLTSYDSGAGSPVDVHGPQHFAPEGAIYTNPDTGIIYRGADDLMTPYYDFSQRKLISENDIGMLLHAYGYTTQHADYYGTMYDTLDSDGTLRIRTPGIGDDQVSISQAGGVVTVNMVIGRPVLGADPTSITSVFVSSAVSRIDIETGHGHDTVTIGAMFGIPIAVSGGTGINSLFIDGVIGSCTLTQFDLVGGSHNFDQISGFQSLTLSGTGGNEIFALNSVPSQVTDLVVNGGPGADDCVIGGGDLMQFSSSPINFVFNGGGDTDEIVVHNAFENTRNWSYGIYGGYLDCLAAGYYLAASYSLIETVTVYGSFRNDGFVLDAVTPDSMNLYGGYGDDSFTVGGGNLSDYLAQNFEGGEGTDHITFNDSLNPSGEIWDIGFYPDEILYGGLVPLLTIGFESVGILAGTGTDTINISNDLHRHLSVNAGGGSDYVYWCGANNWYRNPNGGAITEYNVSLDGGGSNEFDVLSVNDFDYPRLDTQYEITATEFGGFDVVPIEGESFTYADFGFFNVYASNEDNAFNVTGIDPATSYYLYGFGGSDVFTLKTNPTGGGFVQCRGGAGTDHVIVDDHAYPDDADYTTGSSVTRVTGAGRGRSSIQTHYSLSELESLNVTGTAGANSVTISALDASRPLVINGAEGNDTLNVTGAVVRLYPSNSLTFNGNEGYDTFNMLDADAGSTAYNLFSTLLRRNSTDVPTGTLELLNITAGTSVDHLIVFSQEPGQSVVFQGGDGNDAFFTGALSAKGVRGPIQFYGDGGSDNRVTVTDTLDTVGVTAHLDQTTLGARPGDSLFGAGGSLYFSGVQRLEVNCGSGGDTIIAQPNGAAVLNLNLGASAGDTLNLALADADNYVITPGAPGAGSVTSDNLQPLNYGGADTLNSDDTSPAVLDSAFNYEFPPQSITIQFSEDVSASLTSNVIVLTNLSTNQVIPSGDLLLDFDTGTNVATFTFPNFEYGVLPDGEYQLSLPAGAITDAFGNPLQAAHTLDFFFRQGDADHNNVIDFDDYVLIDYGFNNGLSGFSNGDFDGNGVVDFDDYVLLDLAFNGQ